VEENVTQDDLGLYLSDDEDDGKDTDETNDVSYAYVQDGSENTQKWTGRNRTGTLFW